MIPITAGIFKEHERSLLN